MGFGLLFIGYFVATFMSINVIGSFMRIFGYGIIFISASKLNKYNRSFGLLGLSSLVMLAIAMLLALSDVSTFLYDNLLIESNIFGDTYRNIVGYVEMAMSFAFNATMLYAIRSIALETEVGKIATSAVRNFMFICVYYVLNVIGMLPFSWADQYSKYLSAPVLLLYFVWLILNLVLIYSCYARICDENDVEMLRKPSRFAFVNKMREESDRKEQRAAERQAEYRRQKLEKRQNRKK